MSNILKMTSVLNFPKKKIWNTLGAIMGWFAVLGQFVLIIVNRQTDVFETIIRFFSYFTILTNALVALYFTSQIFTGRSLNFLKNNAALTAITSFILVVGLVYQFILRSIWQPAGFQMVIDEFLHTIIPLYMLGYWYLYAKKEELQIKSLFKWLLYPVIYIIFITLRGHFSEYYPYPFLNVKKIGIVQTTINIGIILLTMIVAMIVLIIVGSKVSNKPQNFIL